MILKRAAILVICSLSWLICAHGQAIVNFDLGNNALATNAASFTKLGTGSGYAFKIAALNEYCYTNIGGSGCSLTLTNVNPFGSGGGGLNKDGLHNIAGNGSALFTISNLPAGIPVTIYACYAWDGVGRGAVFDFGGTQITCTNSGTMPNPSLLTLQPVGQATANPDGTVSGRWYGQGGVNTEGQVGALIINVGPCRPVVVLNGANPMGLHVNTAFTDPGANAIETCGNSLTLTANGTVNANSVGSYTLTYTAVSSADDATNSATRTVNVWSSDMLNLDLAKSGDPIPTPFGFNRLNYSAANMTFSALGTSGSTYTVDFTNVGGTYNFTTTNTLDMDGFYVKGTAGFVVSGLTPGDVVTLYACWGWNGAGNAGIVTYGGNTKKIDQGFGVTAPSPGTFTKIGTVVVDSTGTVNGTWTGANATSEGQIGGMIFSIEVLLPGTVGVSPTSVTNICSSAGASATFNAAATAGSAFQWYDNTNGIIPGATNAQLNLTGLKPVNNGIYKVVASGPDWSATNTVTVVTLDTMPPVITLNGNSTVTVVMDGVYTELGATAFDTCAVGSLAVTTNGTVNTSVPGEYDITYSAVTGGGTPGSAIRRVLVIDPNAEVPDFGPNVLIFDPSMPMATIQSQLDAVFAQMENNQFGFERVALFFKPGLYTNLDVNVGYYTQVLGLGQMPDDVTLNGKLHSEGVLANHNATCNFWRSAENLAVLPPSGNITWAVSQATAMRRMHIRGWIFLSNFDYGAYSSGGFMADSKVDGGVGSYTQQQWLSRNDTWDTWQGQVWNMVFVGVSNPPAGSWPNPPYTVITNTPLIREKPYLTADSIGNYYVMVPTLQTNSVGTTWANGPTPGVSLPISQFYLAHDGVDNAATLNAALNAGKNLIFTPGVYHLTNSLLVTRSNTVVLGLGYATLVPDTGEPAMIISDVDGVKIGGLIFDAGAVKTPTLLQVGTTNSALNHAGNPIFLYDICARVGGAIVGKTDCCLTINANDVVGDNLWLWRADHGAGVGWNENVCNNGVIVNGDRVTIYGLFVEHHEQYETLWNGNWGRVYFYQSELPYDPPTQAAWSHDGVDGYASYKVADQVTSHQAYGIGIYAVFINTTDVSCYNAIETPTNSPQVNIHNMINVYIAGNVSAGGTSVMNHIINGTGGSVGPAFGSTTANSLWTNPAFSNSACMNGSNAAVSFPTESCHSYQVQYKNSVTDANWTNLGSPVGGNDTLQTVTDPTPTTSRFYRVVAY